MYNKLITQNRAFLSAKGGSAQEGRTKMKTMKKIWFLMATMAANPAAVRDQRFGLHHGVCGL